MAEFLWTTLKLSEFLGVSPRTIENWRLRGGGPKYVMVGGRPRYQPETVQEWLKSREQRHSSDKAA